jgi:hypothetical protein
MRVQYHVITGTNSHFLWLWLQPAVWQRTVGSEGRLDACLIATGRCPERGAAAAAAAAAAVVVVVVVVVVAAAVVTVPTIDQICDRGAEFVVAIVI